MAEQGYPSPPTEQPVPSVPPVPPVSGASAPGVVYTEPGRPPRRSRAWLWWTLGILAVVGLIVASCVVPLALLIDDDGMTGGFGESIAVIHIDGIIAGTGDNYSGYVTPEWFHDQLDQAESDEAVKAIVLRVDSPGGTVAASEEISLYVKDAKKPIVVSIGDVGASGAYMVSSQSDEIWALPGSSVGSIGVISEIPNVEGLLDKIGVEFTVITAGKYKDAGSPYRPLTDEEKSLIKGEVDEAYNQFIDIVAEGRELKRSEVESMATGWTWSGERALKMGLIDEIGTYADALDSAAERGGIEGDYDIVTYDDEFDELFGSLLGVSDSLQRLSAVAEQANTATGRAPLPR